MTWISKAVTGFGLLLLAHACYSAQEHSALQSHRASLSSDPLTSTSTDGPVLASLPADIVVETLVATLLTIVGLVLSSGSLRPIRWREWAGKIEREGEDGFRSDGGTGEVEKDYVGNPFRYLETRPGFVDVRRQRREFTEWVVTSGEKK